MLLTRDRVQALSRIHRYVGWTTRPYSVLEHSVIGAKLTPNRTLQKAFLLHDMEESAFGDIISPVKRKYMPEAYFMDVEAWVRNLAAETSVPYSAIDGEQVHFFDRVMLAAEKSTIYAGLNRMTGEPTMVLEAEIPTGGYALCDWAKQVIKSEAYAGDNAINAFWQMWSGQ